jgi:hypothetical protein
MAQNFSRMLVFFAVIPFVTAGCFKDESKNFQITNNFCAPRSLSSNAKTVGQALSFLVDPIVSSGNANLSPTSKNLGSYVRSVGLENLTGKGVLEGKYVDVRSGYFDPAAGYSCNEWYGAFDSANNFSFPFGDPRFQEGMSYYLGNKYRSRLDEAGYLQPVPSVRVVAHCMDDDNAYYSPERDSNGHIFLHRVCLGDSTSTPGASYADDGVVAVHELQHATTGATYSSELDFNQLWYDEAGAANEAISDFAALMMAAPDVPQSDVPLDPKLFSRWALRLFMPGREFSRGAHFCPAYDPAYPSCLGSGLRYTYPDGLGWPYAKKSFSGPTYDARNAFLKYSNQEEIHNTGNLFTGGLYDAFDSLKQKSNSDHAQLVMTQIVHEAIKHLPKPTEQNLSPISFRGIASEIMNAVDLLGVSLDDKITIHQALSNRGLLGGVMLTSDWATALAGENLQIRVVDHPLKLKVWLEQMGSDSSKITHGIETGTNNQFDPGEVLAVWFDLVNHLSESAGGIVLDVTIEPGDEAYVTFLDRNTNIAGVSSTRAQIMYSKVNGSLAVSNLNSLNVPAGNTYSTTNPFYSNSFRTALWVKVNPSAPSGTSVRFNINAKPSNGQVSHAIFTTTIH